MNEPAPSTDELYGLLLARDPRFDGRWYVGVRSTGIFCRLSCPARKPKRESCEFFSDPGECVSRGFRPCRRCRPLDREEALPQWVEHLLEQLAAEPGRRWTQTDLQRAGYDPSTVRRGFRRHFGTTFLALARLRRLQCGSVALGAGHKVIDAQLEAGFESSSGFRAAVSKLLGVAPATLSGSSATVVDWIDGPLGPMVAVADGVALHLLEFADRRALGAELRRLKTRLGRFALGTNAVLDGLRSELDAFFRGEAWKFRTPIAPHGTPLQREVWSVLRTIPVGETRSYGEIARAIGRPRAFRAVARANGANTIAIVVPCHRVVGADGSMTGYGGGVWRKRELIALERQIGTRSPA